MVVYDCNEIVPLEGYLQGKYKMTNCRCRHIMSERSRSSKLLL
jgi:hypothetical protein